ncbi:MAG: tetratricopeptide repeat protein [Chitinivibrionales bacterium]|nr:tetratricopeptide repeat protein [Chitinivibrionales bacterium]MBD3355858.1 tetratricopeptide repeat protein [Chitinivibrionales bacterium]
MKMSKKPVAGFTAVVIALLMMLGGRTPALADIPATGGFASPYFQADYIQDLTEYSAGIVNPALLYRVNQYRLEFGLYRWKFSGAVLTDLGYQQVSVLAPLGLRHTVGLTVLGLGGTTPNVDLESHSLAEDSTSESRYGDMWFVGHYGMRLFPWLALGTNLKFMRQNQFSIEKAFGWGLDFGVYANPINHYRWGDLGFSLNFQDVKPVKLTWKHDSEGEKLADSSAIEQLMTTRLRAGMRYSGMNDRIVFSFEYVLDNFMDAFWESVFSLEEGEILNQAKDIKNNLDRVGRYGAHLKYEFIPQIWVKAGWANNNIPYVGFNLNLIYPLPEMVNFAKFDFHVGYSVNEPERGLTTMFKLASDFGPTREQRMSRGLYEKLTLEPRNEYNKAMRLYMAQKYWDAAFAFGNLISVYPNFHLNDKATFLMGNCYRELYLNDIAREIYKEALAEYSTSEQRPNFLYGLMDLDYKENKHEDALKNHAFINNLYPESDARAEADYLAGQIHFQRKNYNAAEQLFNQIQPGDEPYLFSQYTLSIINTENKKVKAAIRNLETIVADTSGASDILLLQDAANNKLGQLYFEQVDLRKAVEAFKRVPEGSGFGDDALLGTAWSWIKVNRPELCLKEIARLIAAHSESPHIAEAYLLRGYALMLQPEHKAAIEALEKSLELAKRDLADEEDLKAEKREYEQFERIFAPTAQQIKKNALRKPTDKLLAERPELKREYERFAQKNRALFDFKVLVEDNEKFFRRKEQILLDAEYALAKATKMVGSAQEEKLIDRERKKQQELDEKIRKLEQELQGVDE